ncbi:hypothetical protein [Acinetobacter terrae]|uniref:Uncharacterized protein n=1 Tax=Acinetobacter terrae TaxID=2731247 RepID=A0A8E4GLK7_9GAMM|nr:hypothetical protein [Acinetobacter terrae]NNH37486.1 hypothetical protein [Acinetobacter terrae]
MNCWKNKVSSLLYKNGQIGLVFFLFTIILLHLPSVIYGSVFLAPITGNEADYYSKFGAWFTAIGAIFTIINTIVVIYLMIYLYKKESEFTILPFISELHKQLLDIEITIKEEINFLMINNMTYMKHYM